MTYICALMNTLLGEDIKCLLITDFVSATASIASLWTRNKQHKKITCSLNLHTKQTLLNQNLSNFNNIQNCCITTYSSLSQSLILLLTYCCVNKSVCEELHSPHPSSRGVSCGLIL